MFKRILAAGILLASALAFGQGACYPAGVVLLDTGRPANGASVRVCTAGSTGSPCTPGASLFTDPTLGTPLGGSPVVTTDAHGNFGFCAAAGSNYDLQISGTGITTLNIKNLPLPPTTPIAAASLTSSSANPATVGQIKLASGDCLDWRNNANSGNIQLCKTGAAAGNVPADTFDMTAFGGARAASFISGASNPSATGAVALASADCVKFRNNANGADLNGVCKNASDQVAIGSGPFVVPSANDQAVGRATTDTLTNKTLTSPVINGTPTGTGIPTLTLKKGTGAGNYTTASTTYAVADSTNLCYTVTIPTGWKLMANAAFTIGSLTAAVNVLAALTDNAACSTANAGILQEGSITPPAVGAGVSMSLAYVINGDGASHNVAMQFRTTNAADSAFISNNSTILPTMTFLLSTSN